MIPVPYGRGLLAILNDEEYRKRLIEDIFKNVTRYRLEKVADQYWPLYREPVAGKTELKKGKTHQKQQDVRYRGNIRS